jgi:hypothetical protein
MPECPKCHKNIDHLIMWEKLWILNKLSIKNGTDDSREAVATKEEESYDCPRCGATLFEDYNYAVKFLKGNNKI